VLVYGDTNSTIAGALAAVKLMVPVAHVEAGLRSWNRSMPEEINRVVCDTISSLLFCPTHQSVHNLAREGIQQGVHLVGDVMGDSLQHHLALARQNSHILSTHGLEPGKYALVTVHRAGNTDDPQKLAALLAALGKLPGQVVFPVHPRTARSIKEHGLKLASNIKPIDPVGYLDMLQLEANADCILTDSGGVQKEAYWLGVRCITLRDETEWVETVDAGWNRLTGSDPDAILEAVLHWHPSGEREPVYGDGHAAERIVSLLAGEQSPRQEIFSSSPFPGEHKL
jgi:UDP-N-acetylglucosamine 2-epimerase